MEWWIFNIQAIRFFFLLFSPNISIHPMHDVCISIQFRIIFFSRLFTQKPIIRKAFWLFKHQITSIGSILNLYVQRMFEKHIIDFCLNRILFNVSSSSKKYKKRILSLPLFLCENSLSLCEWMCCLASTIACETEVLFTNTHNSHSSFENEIKKNHQIDRHKDDFCLLHQQ